MKPSRVCPLNKCTGCFACFNICPSNAISFEEDKYGNVHPIIDIDKCTGCNLCRNTCPALSKNLKFKYPRKCYAAYSKSVGINIKSSSGGVANELGKYIISNNGIYYGVSSYLNNNEIVFERISKTSELEKVQGSKYVHALVRDTYKKIKQDLEAKKEVLFIGSPCQIAGLKCYLKKEYSNLYTVDLICHGVPSQKLLKEEIGTDFDYVSFRQGNRFNLIAKNNGTTVYEKNKYSSIYYNLFLKGIIYRENCYTCKYARNERIGDITIGDFWRLKDEKIKSKHGTSIVLLNTQKGEDLFNKININKKEEIIELGLKNNPQLNYPTKKTIQHDEFLEQYINKSLKQCKKIYSIRDHLYIIKGNIKEKIKKAIQKR